MADRPFRDYSEAELIGLLHSRQKNELYAEKRRRAFWNEFGGEGRDNRWMNDDEDYQGLERQVEICRREVADVQAEFTARRKEREARRMAREGRAGSANGGGLVPLECSCSPPRRIKVTQKVYDGGPVICGLCHQSFKGVGGTQAGQRPR
jgi:hypothetical protein